MFCCGCFCCKKKGGKKRGEKKPLLINEKTVKSIEADEFIPIRKKKVVHVKFSEKRKSKAIYYEEVKKSPSPFKKPQIQPMIQNDTSPLYIKIDKRNDLNNELNDNKDFMIISSDPSLSNDQIFENQENLTEDESKEECLTISTMMSSEGRKKSKLFEKIKFQPVVVTPVTPESQKIQNKDEKEVSTPEIVRKIRNDIILSTPKKETPKRHKRRKSSFKFNNTPFKVMRVRINPKNEVQEVVRPLFEVNEKDSFFSSSRKDEEFRRKSFDSPTPSLEKIMTRKRRCDSVGSKWFKRSVVKNEKNENILDSLGRRRKKKKKKKKKRRMIRTPGIIRRSKK